MSSLGQDDQNDENNKGMVYDECQMLVYSWKNAKTRQRRI